MMASPRDGWDHLAIAEFRGELQAIGTRIGELATKVEVRDERYKRIDEKLAHLEESFEALEKDVTALGVKIDNLQMAADRRTWVVTTIRRWIVMIPVISGAIWAAWEWLAKHIKWPMP